MRCPVHSPVPHSPPGGDAPGRARGRTRHAGRRAAARRQLVLKKRQTSVRAPPHDPPQPTWRHCAPLRSPERSSGRLDASCGASKPALGHRQHDGFCAFNQARRPHRPLRRARLSPYRRGARPRDRARSGAAPGDRPAPGAVASGVHARGHGAAIKNGAKQSLHTRQRNYWNGAKSREDVAPHSRPAPRVAHAVLRRGWLKMAPYSNFHSDPSGLKVAPIPRPAPLPTPCTSRGRSADG